MQTASEQEIINTLNTFLQAGRLNEAHKFASTSMPYSLENVDFINLLSTSLQQLGFIPESNSLKSFADNLRKHRNNQSRKDTQNFQIANTADHSAEYKIDGKTFACENPVWDRRAMLIANNIKPEASLLDLGCGNMLIEKYLVSPKNYFPCDISPRDERTIVCDFDKLEYPDDLGEDHIICMGVVNYLKHQTELLDHICTRQKNFHFSFKPKNLIQLKISEGIFPEAMTFEQAVDIVHKHGFEIKYQFMMGQGDEIVIIANLPKH
ncbi:hypothetical protein NBRC116493_16760 [Aurantivibrio infirmus]